MKGEIKHYVITHKSGSKANQVEEFDFQRYPLLTLGRAGSNDVKFDSEMDTMVSREHAKIVRDSETRSSFSIIDNNSKNGLFVNGKKVEGTVKIFPGDTVEMGKGGPSFVFDLNPRPGASFAETKVMDLPKPTQEIETPVAEVVPAKTGIGKQTFERAIAVEQQKSNRKLLAGLAAALLVIGAVGFVIWNNSEGKILGLKKDQALQDSLNKAEQERLLSEKGMLPEEIVALNEDKVVRIEAAWQLFDPNTSDEVWHVYVPVKQQDGSQAFVATYIVNQQGKIEPYLGLKKNVQTGIPIGSAGLLGTGFVVSEDGFILTNRHVASAWNSNFTFPDFAFPGILLDQNGKSTNKVVNASDLGGWVPSEATMLEGRPLQQKIGGRNTSFNVVFANTAQRRNCTVEAISDKHDAALVKVSMPTKLPYVELLDNYNEIKSGQSVVVMGYPAVSPEMIVVRRSSDGLKPSGELNTVPIPTVTSGLVGRLMKWSPENRDLYSTFGDAYQLTINATGPGNSGGPMFDDKGRVIGIFYAGTNDPNQPKVTFAVPIKYGLELMGHDKVF